MWVLLYKTPVGLSIRAVGENEHAAESLGIKVRRIQYTALAISGSLAGLGGAFMSMYYSQGWNSGMVAGRGFIALAAQALGQGEPVGTMLSSLLFGLAQALRTKVSALQGASSYLVSVIPYVATVLGLVIYAAATIRRVKKARRTKPVSYTHLDVYKRQEQQYSKMHDCRVSIGCAAMRKAKPNQAHRCRSEHQSGTCARRRLRNDKCGSFHTENRSPAALSAAWALLTCRATAAQ